MGGLRAFSGLLVRIVWVGLQLGLGKDYRFVGFVPILWVSEKGEKSVLCVALGYRAGFDFGSSNDFRVAWALYIFGF